MMINGRNVKLYNSMFDYVEDADFVNNKNFIVEAYINV
jgi:hypothetical protein